MPITESSWETLAADIKAAPSEVFVLFTGAKDESGKSWCPPCNAVAPDIKRVFEDSDTNRERTPTATLTEDALVVPFEIEDFDACPWPAAEWALLGVPMIYRLRDGELSGAFLMHNDLPFAAMLDAYVAGPDAYEAWTEQQRGDSYVPAATRWEWAREDFAEGLQIQAAKQAKSKRRAEVKKAFAEKRKAEREAKAGEGEGTGEEAKKAKTEAELCTGVECAA